MATLEQPGDAAQSTLTKVRVFLAAIFVVEAVGVAGELLLISHTEGMWQQIPLWAMAGSVAALLAYGIWRSRAARRLFQLSLIVMIAAGALGVWLHYDSKAEFKQELNPSLSGWDLFWEAVAGATTPPVLAPGVLIQMAALGFLITYGQKAGEPAG